MTQRPPTFDRSAIWGSAILLAGAMVWNGGKGDWVDALFLLELGIGGALLLGARRLGQDVDSHESMLRWSGLLLLGILLVTQVILLVRYLALSLW